MGTNIISGIFLFIFGIALSFIYFVNSGINPNVLSYNHNNLNIVQDKNGLTRGTITAQENYFGILTIQFDKKRLIDGRLIFRIKENLDKDWYHTAIIDDSGYLTSRQYEFGIPTIEKSKNKIYQFEIKPLSKNEIIVFGKGESILISNYIYPKIIFLKDIKILKNFIEKKIIYYVHVKNGWKVFVLYSLPSFLYLLYISILYRFVSNKTKRLLRTLTKPISLITLTAIAIDIFIIRKYSPNVVILLILFWIITIVLYRFKAKISFVLALIFLVFTSFLLIIPMDWVAEKSAIWVYIMITVGTIQSIKDLV